MKTRVLVGERTVDGILHQYHYDTVDFYVYHASGGRPNGTLCHSVMWDKFRQFMPWSIPVESIKRAAA